MIVVISHAHPSVSKGGAEVSAYTLYTGLRQLGVATAFVAMVPEHDADRVSFATPDEYIIEFRPDSYDHVLHCAGPDMFEAAQEVLAPLAPSMLVFHHFLNLGINVVRQLVDHFKCPSAMVLHEFLAICHHHGQMVTHPQKRLCSASSPTDCFTCFPQFSPEHFHCRKSLFQETFSRMYRLISPSHFLADRFVDWGIDKDRLTVIENGLIGLDHSREKIPEGGKTKIQPETPPARKRVGRKTSASSLDLESSSSGVPKVFGYFGQINPFKGLDLLLDALDLLEARKVGNIRLRIHGNVVGVDDAFRKRFDAMVEQSDLLEYQGPYVNADVEKLMSACDYVVMASKWWENSPVVIQESFAAGRPLIVPDIGGMAEKVVDGEGGRHFKFGNAEDLARVLLEAALEVRAYKLPAPFSARDMAAEYLKAMSGSGAA